VDPDFDWNLPLRHRRGAPTNLLGIDVFFDFNWSDLVGHPQTQFQNGQCLARRIGRECPDDKEPALLLTSQDDAEEVSFESSRFFVMVINLQRYLKAADGDAAVSYLAQKFGPGVTRIGQLAEPTGLSPEESRAFFDRQLTADRIATWATGNADRLEQLREIVGEQPVTGKPNSALEAITALEALDALDEEVVSALVALLGPKMDRDLRLALLRTLTDNSAGRRDAGEIMGQRAAERMQDARRATAEFSDLLADLDSNETDLQEFIEANIWVLGLDYVQMRPKYALPRGVMDFILERYDGFHDLLELKDPQDSIIEAPEENPPPPANKYKLSTALAKALAQTHIYRHTLTEHGPTTEELFGLPQSRDPRVVIVIGKAATLPDHRAGVLRELNKSLHRVEIVPYDILAKRANAILDSVEKYLQVDAVENS
jgi:hypothetical protein